MGVTEARNLFRSYGMRMSNGAFGQIYGQVRAAISNEIQIAGLTYDAIPSGDVYTKWAAGTPDQYASFVQTYTRARGSSDIQTHFSTYVTADPHTPQEAIDWAQEESEMASAQGGTFEGQTTMMSVVTSMTRTVARAA
jgi:hypothetical protein